MEWWGTESWVTSLAIAESRAMKTKFREGALLRVRTSPGAGGPEPEFHIRVLHCRLCCSGKMLLWEMRFRFENVELQGTPDEYAFTLGYPSNYPGSAPTARILTPLGKGIPHFFQESHRPCLYRPDDGRAHGWDPGGGDTAAVMASWVVEWLLAYRYWEDTGKWPRTGVG